MTIYDEQNRLPTASSAAPKAWFAIGLAGGLWLLLAALGFESLQLLRMLGA